MKNKRIWLSIWLLCVAIGMSSCINDDVPRGGNGGEVFDEGEGNVVFKFMVPNDQASTKATTETSGVYETGNPNEYAVKNVTVYLFHATTKAFVKSFSMSSFEIENGTPQVGEGNLSSDQKSHIVCYKAKRQKIDEGTYDIFAVANGGVTESFSSESQFLDIIDAFTYKDGLINLQNEKGFVMTNRGDNSGVYDGSQKGTNLGVYVKEKLSTEDPTFVNIILERVVAKVLVGKTSNSFKLEADGKEYASINLTSYYPINLSTKYYTFRHTAVLNSFLKPANYVIPDHFGEVATTNGYVIDPYFFNKTESGSNNFTNPDGYYVYPLGENNSSRSRPIPGPTGDMPQFSFFYCLENCMHLTAQKNAYSTGVRFKAALTPSTIFDENKQETNSRPETLYYANYRFYSSLDALKKAIDLPGDVVDDEASLSKYSVRKFYKDGSEYYCYYNYWIRHLDNNDNNTMGVMEFAIVRNNIYRLLVSGVSELGSGSPEVDPGKDDETNAILEIKFCVLPWIVRNQGGDGGVVL